MNEPERVVFYFEPKTTKEMIIYHLVYHVILFLSPPGTYKPNVGAERLSQMAVAAYVMFFSSSKTRVAAARKYWDGI